MRALHKLGSLVCLLLLSLLVVSCHDNDDPEPDPAAEYMSVTIIFATNGLGDLTYNDDLMTKFMSFAYDHEYEDVESHVVSPTTKEQGAAAFRYWLANADKPAKPKRLLVLASPEYEAMLDTAHISLADGNEILLLESRRDDMPQGVTCLDVSLYGVSYMVGRTLMTQERKRVVAVLACPGEKKLQEGVDGLRDGITDGSPDEGTLDVVYLADDASGFAMADSARVMATSLKRSESYDWVYPLCGGSALGFYSELYGLPSPIGMDVDCSEFSNSIRFSAYRKVGQALYDALTRWAGGETLPRNISYGIADGYTGICNNSNLHKDWLPIASQFTDEAISKEKAYMKEKH